MALILLSTNDPSEVLEYAHCLSTLICLSVSANEPPESRLVLDFLSFDAAILSALRRSPVLGQKVFTHIAEECILKHLNLAKLSISENQMIVSLALEVLEVAQEVWNATVGLCRAYHQALNSESGGMGSDKLNHVANITTYTIDCLYELGVLSETRGESLVTILNVLWKGVVTSLQLTAGDVATKVNVTDHLLTLISLATNSLRCAAESWSSTVKEDITLTEAKRTFTPVKFYLTNAVRLLSEYPCQAFTIYKEITLCGLMISTFHVSLSKTRHLKASSEALTELLEPILSLLIHSIFKSVEVKQESKLQILDWLFADADDTSPILEEMNTNLTTLMKDIFSVTCGRPQQGVY
ncbi:hypothetical protein IFM89_026833 [Coptis chinensis]|uniref:Uncharacterized protein n=1 Tax=Coptis chinensis TaxID=261450 RepID=A0A835H163_9MAGN|nr:hypothetical protein IFM89_026833 [Coptis chinensis]